MRNPFQFLMQVIRFIIYNLALLTYKLFIKHLIIIVKVLKLVV